MLRMRIGLKKFSLFYLRVDRVVHPYEFGILFRRGGRLCPPSKTFLSTFGRTKVEQNSRSSATGLARALRKISMYCVNCDNGKTWFVENQKASIFNYDFFAEYITKFFKHLIVSLERRWRIIIEGGRPCPPSFYVFIYLCLH